MKMFLVLCYALFLCGFYVAAWLAVITIICSLLF